MEEKNITIEKLIDAELLTILKDDLLNYKKQQEESSNQQKQAA
jgi:hypothetical protein